MNTIASDHVLVDCLVRARIPTPHGEIFLHCYSNNVDKKEHLAVVFDDQVRSQSLASKEGTERDRLVIGQYRGSLRDELLAWSRTSPSPSLLEPPLVRIHSECYTGETLGSQRCDCGEQLDEAMRLMAEERRGVVVYLRQEGRGIGLAEKLKAYNLQDLGHDTVDANLILGHGSDVRRYDIARAILQDLGIGSVRLLTNNPDKIDQIEALGVKVMERVPMIPRKWISKATRDFERAARRRDKAKTRGFSEARDDEGEKDAVKHFYERMAGVGMIGGSETNSHELDRYLQTKIEKMGHILDMPVKDDSSPSPPLETAPRVRTLTEGSNRSETGSRNGRRRPHPLSRRLSASSERDSMADSFMSLPSLAGSIPGSLLGSTVGDDVETSNGTASTDTHSAKMDRGDGLQLDRISSQSGGEKTSEWIKSQELDGYPLEETYSDDDLDAKFPPWSDEKYQDSELDSEDERMYQDRLDRRLEYAMME